MEIEQYLQILLFILCCFGGIAILIFVLRHQEQQEYNYDEILKKLNKEKQDNLEILKTRNKEIDIIERKIFEKKKN